MPARGWPLLRLGFRPFYLGAAAFAALAVPLWVAAWFGQITLSTALAPMLWHGHEMLFGFAVAVIIGFLLTAGQGWTGLATPRGAALGGLVALWLAARVAALTAPYAIYAALDMALLPLVAALLTRLLLRAGNHRNLPLALILMLLALANGAFHLAALGLTAINPLMALHAGLALVVMVLCVMAGRVVPAFTKAATPGMVLPPPKLERWTMAMTALGLAGWVFAPAGLATAAVLGLAAALHLRRQWAWQPWLTRSRPILWILHAGYAWIAVGLGLLALAQLGLVSESAGLHALTVGATSGLIIGMITRTARGHTGRSLQAGKAETSAYALVMAAALLRSLLPIFGLQSLALLGAAMAWSSAFVIYLYVYTPWLLAARIDGRDG
jgi:uncharacterized protein involved in response to NO